MNLLTLVLNRDTSEITDLTERALRDVGKKISTHNKLRQQSPNVSLFHWIKVIIKWWKQLMNLQEEEGHQRKYTHHTQASGCQQSSPAPPHCSTVQTQFWNSTHVTERSTIHPGVTGEGCPLAGMHKSERVCDAAAAAAAGWSALLVPAAAQRDWLTHMLK